MQNIKNELEAGEVDAWQKLIRVLTHEIMNSVTPITSLSDTLLDIVQPSYTNKMPLDQESVNKVYTGLKAIRERNTGLRSFAKAYQSLTRLPAPDFKFVNAQEFLEKVRILVNPELQSIGITLKSKTEPLDHSFLADEEQIIQVILNLLKNSKEAFNEDDSKKGKEIQISIIGDKSQTEILIIDNGRGISKESMDKIFVPFFTTKKSGSGIGLALARQIIHQHNGTIQVNSVENEGTIARISL